MNIIPYWLVSTWGFDYDEYGYQNVFVVILKYAEYKKLKEEHEELLLTYQTTEYNKENFDITTFTNIDCNEENYYKFSPQVSMSDELALYLALIDGKNILDT